MTLNVQIRILAYNDVQNVFKHVQIILIQPFDNLYDAWCCVILIFQRFIIILSSIKNNALTLFKDFYLKQ